MSKQWLVRVTGKSKNNYVRHTGQRSDVTYSRYKNLAACGCVRQKTLLLGIACASHPEYTEKKLHPQPLFPHEKAEKQEKDIRVLRNVLQPS